MPGITLLNGLLIYYGNPAGYQGKAGLIADPIFRGGELEAWLEHCGLTVHWEEGVYDHLSHVGWGGEETVGSPPGTCRIWQLRPSVAAELKFAPLDRVVDVRGGPHREDYAVVYDGPVEKADPESVWEQFRLRNVGEGHPLSISDVIELSDMDGSRFYYIDRTQLRAISFDTEVPAQSSAMQVNYLVGGI